LEQFTCEFLDSNSGSTIVVEIFGGVYHFDWYAVASQNFSY